MGLDDCRRREGKSSMDGGRDTEGGDYTPATIATREERKKRGVGELSIQPKAKKVFEG